jgi:hypothetical protein
MRDPNRIEPMLAAIHRLWVKHPDWRLGQLLENAKSMTQVYPEAPMFHVEDDELLAGIKALTDPQVD